MKKQFPNEPNGPGWYHSNCFPVQYWSDPVELKSLCDCQVGIEPTVTLNVDDDDEETPFKQKRVIYYVFKAARRLWWKQGFSVAALSSHLAVHLLALRRLRVCKQNNAWALPLLPRNKSCIFLEKLTGKLCGNHDSICSSSVKHYLEKICCRSSCKRKQSRLKKAVFLSQQLHICGCSWPPTLQGLLADIFFTSQPVHTL